MDEVSRRILLRRMLQVGAALTVLPVSLSANAADSCVDATSESLRTSLHYSNPSAKPSESCRGCGFFSTDSGKPACGNCQIMSGPVDSSGHCDSWAAKS